MTPERLKKAGWLAVANAILTVPLFLLSLMLGMDGSYGARAVQTSVGLLSTLLFIYVMLTLLDYLHGSRDFRDVDRPVKVLLWMNIAVTVFSMLGLLNQSFREAAGLLAMVLVVPSGAAQAVFGYRLLRLPDLLGGKLKPFCLLNMVTGVSFALIVAIPLGLMTSAAADVILGMIFLDAAGKRQ